MFLVFLMLILNRSVKRETLKLIETFLDKAEDQHQIGKQFVPPMMDPVLGDYARNLPDARESEVLSLFATIINKYPVHLLLFLSLSLSNIHPHVLLLIQCSHIRAYGWLMHNAW